jgi:hypothetical protein
MIELIVTAILAAAPPGPAAPADPPSIYDLPAPPSLQRAAVLAWTAKYVHGGAWKLLAYDYEGVKLAAPGAVRRTPDGLAEAEVRTELFRPVELRVGVARSGVARWAVDCKANRLAVLSMSVYVGHNLQEKLASRTAVGRPWQEPVGSEAEAIRSVCLAVGDRAPTPAGMP